MPPPPLATCSSAPACSWAFGIVVRSGPPLPPWPVAPWQVEQFSANTSSPAAAAGRAGAGGAFCGDLFSPRRRVGGPAGRRFFAAGFGFFVPARFFGFFFRFFGRFLFLARVLGAFGRFFGARLGAQLAVQRE